MRGGLSRDIVDRARGGGGEGVLVRRPVVYGNDGEDLEDADEEQEPTDLTNSGGDDDDDGHAVRDDISASSLVRCAFSFTTRSGCDGYSRLEEAAMSAVAAAAKDET